MCWDKFFPYKFGFVQLANSALNSFINHLRCVMLATGSVVNNDYKMYGGVEF
jgi:hypothetical protein